MRVRMGQRQRYGRSAELAADVLFGELLARIVENLVGVSDFDEIASAPAFCDLNPEEGGDVGDAGRLLHIVGHKRNRIVLFELRRELPDAWSLVDL